jgi:hypothetical protein
MGAGPECMRGATMPPPTVRAFAIHQSARANKLKNLELFRVIPSLLYKIITGLTKIYNTVPYNSQFKG